MHHEIQKRVTVNAQKAPPSKHYFDGSMSEMSSEHRASPVSFYTVITRQTTAHFSLLSPVTTPHTGRREAQTRTIGKPPTGLCFPVLGFLPAGTIVTMLESSSERRNFQAHGTRLQIHQFSSIFFSTAPTQMKAETYLLLVFIHLFFSERQVPCRSLISLGESKRHSKRKLEPVYSREETQIIRKKLGPHTHWNSDLLGMAVLSICLGTLTFI